MAVVAAVLCCAAPARAAEPNSTSQQLRVYWRGRAVDPPGLWLGGRYAGAVVPHSFQGAAIRSRQSFDLTADVLLLPWVMVGLRYSRDRWRAPDAPSAVDFRLNRIEFNLALDPIALPHWWAVRVALLPNVSLGTAWGRTRFYPARYEVDQQEWIVGSRQQKWYGGPGINPGCDVALYVRLGRRVSLQIRGGVNRPTYLLRTGRDRLPHPTGFVDAWRWHVGLGLGPGPAQIPLSAQRHQSL